jgi:hypothetical protein
MPDFSRDIAFDSKGFGQFTAPFTGLFWFVNSSTTKVSLSKAGKAAQTISANEVTVLQLSKGEELGLVGTAGNSISVYDHFDVKLVPTAKDILGTVQLANNFANLVTPLFATIDVAASGDNTIIAADTTNKIKVLSYVLVVDGAVGVRWKSGAGTNLSGLMSLAANGGISYTAPTPLHGMETALNAALVLNLSGAVGARGHLLYIKET